MINQYSNVQNAKLLVQYMDLSVCIYSQEWKQSLITIISMIFSELK